MCAELFYVTINHLLVNLKPATFWIELQEAPSDLPRWNTIVDSFLALAGDAYTTGFLCIELIFSLAAMSKCWGTATDLDSHDARKFEDTGPGAHTGLIVLAPEPYLIAKAVQVWSASSLVNSEVQT